MQCKLLPWPPHCFAWLAWWVISPPTIFLNVLWSLLFNYVDFFLILRLYMKDWIWFQANHLYPHWIQELASSPWPPHFFTCMVWWMISSPAINVFSPLFGSCLILFRWICWWLDYGRQMVFFFFLFFLRSLLPIDFDCKLSTSSPISVF